MKVVLDTNILIYAIKVKVDLLRQIHEKFNGEAILPNLVKAELGKLAETAKRGSDKKAAKLALEILVFSKVKEIELEGHADDAILDWAKKNKAMVATNDLQFRKALKKEGIPCFYLKQNQLLKA